MRLVRFSVVASICLLCLINIGFKQGDPTGVQMKLYAETLLGELDDEQKKTVSLAYESEKRTAWHFIPKKERKGLALRDMNSAQRLAALRLLRATLSQAGYGKASKIMLLEGVIREFEGDDRNWERDPQKYFVTLFGTPSDSEAWAMSFEGHHLSLNFSIRGGKVVDSTPQFWGANPGTVMREVKAIPKGTRVLRAEEQRAFKLINALSKNQQATAIIAEKAPKEIRFTGEAQANVSEAEGIAFNDISVDNQKLLKSLVNTYVNAVAEDVAAARQARIKEDGWNNVHFAWAGALEPGIGHYYRVRGKRFLIEFINVQADADGNPANHIHCVWRDLTGDFDLPIK